MRISELQQANYSLHEQWYKERRIELSAAQLWICYLNNANTNSLSGALL